MLQIVDRQKLERGREQLIGARLCGRDLKEINDGVVVIELLMHFYN